jgi:hypothetical protein
MNYDKFLWFIEERETIRLKKFAGLPRPWSENPILNYTRFCNIDRIHDAGTTRLLNYISNMDDWEKVYYTVLYRSALSSYRFLDSMTGIWMHDYRNLRHLDLSISDARKPYQVFLYGGDTMKAFLVNVSSWVAKKIHEVHTSWNDISILEASDYIADQFKTLYRKRMIFLATEIAKDLSYFLSIDPDSECYMNIGARYTLKKFDGRRNSKKIEELLTLTNLSPSSLEHSLCEFGRYLTRECYYEEHGFFKKEWMY